MPRKKTVKTEEAPRAGKKQRKPKTLKLKKKSSLSGPAKTDVKARLAVRKGIATSRFVVDLKEELAKIENLGQAKERAFLGRLKQVKSKFMPARQASEKAGKTEGRALGEDLIIKQEIETELSGRKNLEAVEKTAFVGDIENLFAATERELAAHAASYFFKSRQDVRDQEAKGVSENYDSAIAVESDETLGGENFAAPEPACPASEKSSFREKIWNWLSPIDRLAIVSLARLILFFLKHLGRGVHLISYHTGYYSIFAIRFFILVFFLPIKTIASLLAAILKKIFWRSEKDKGEEWHFVRTGSDASGEEWGWRQIAFADAKKYAPAMPASEPLASSIRPSAPEKAFTWRILVPSVNARNFRSTIFFLAALFAVVSVFKAFSFYNKASVSDWRGRVLGASEKALAGLADGARSAGELDFGAAENNFKDAAGNFAEAQRELDKINDLIFVLASLAPDENIRMAAESKKILKAGEYASSLARNLAKALENIQKTGNGMAAAKIMDNFVNYGLKAVDDAGRLDAVLREIELDNLPAEYREAFVAARERSVFAKEGLSEFVDIVSKLKIILGGKEDKRYLIVFQNNAEMRATGGFIGSFALVDFRNGKIKNIEVPGGGGYDTEAGLREKIAAPEPLRLVRADWHFWDANWWPDWPTTARKLEWFYEKSSGPTVDGVIGITPTVMEDLLRVIGPVDMTDKYGLVITADNFWLETQKITEYKINATSTAYGQALVKDMVSASSTTEKPKKIIGDLLEKIIAEAPKRLSRDVFFKLVQVMEDNLGGKQILFYFNNRELENKIAEYGWDGSVRPSNRDYLMVVNSNIAGGKSDRKIIQRIEHAAEIMPDGSIVDTVRIERRHTGRIGDLFTGVRNVDWLRVYVPEGSELMEADGFKAPDPSFFDQADKNWQTDPDVSRAEAAARTDEANGTKIYNEAGKTVFANWSIVDRGQTAVITLKYRLPFKMMKEKRNDVYGKMEKIIDPESGEFYAYALLAQKQPGSYHTEIISKLKIPENARLAWRYPKAVKIDDRGWFLGDDLNRDKLWAIVYELK